MKRILKLTNGHTLEDIRLTIYGGNTQVTKYASLEAWDRDNQEWLEITPECGYYYEDDYDEDYDEENDEYYRTYYEEGDTWQERVTNYIQREVYSNLEFLCGIDLYEYAVKVIFE